MADQKSIFTRRELYDLVWKKPVETLAAEFGMSGRGLGKLCERHGIPVPPRGYWARNVAGKRVIRPPLLELSGAGREETIQFSLPKVSSKPADTAQPVDPFKDMWIRQTQDIPAFQIADRLLRPHPIIARLIEDEKRRAEERKRSPRLAGYFESKLNKPLDQRRLRILDAVFKRLEAMGLAVEHDPRQGPSIFAKVGHDKAEFKLTEYIRQYRRPLSDEEKSRSWNVNQKWTQEKEPTGKLVLKITSWLPNGVASEFRETEEKALEEMLPSAVAALIVAIAYAKDRREEQAASEQRRWEAQQRAWKLEQERKAEEARKAALRQKAASWREAALLRDYVVAVRAAVADGNPVIAPEELEQWSAWALRHAEEIDPMTAKSSG